MAKITLSGVLFSTVEGISSMPELPFAFRLPITFFTSLGFVGFKYIPVGCTVGVARKSLKLRALFEGKVLLSLLVMLAK